MGGWEVRTNSEAINAAVLLMMIERIGVFVAAEARERHFLRRGRVVALPGHGAAPAELQSRVLDEQRGFT